jgi:purine-binding chemotaxis protein CheW
MNTRSLSELLSELSPQEIAILEERARALAHHTDESAVEATISVLTFHLAKEIYAVPVELVREIRPLNRLTRVPFAPDFVEGVMNLRGNLLTLINLRRFLGITTERSDLQMVMVVEANGLEIGILTDRVSDVLTLPFSDLKPAPMNTLAASYIDGVSAEGIIVINLIALLADPKLAISSEHI